MPKRLSMAAVLLMATTALAQTTDPETPVFDELSTGNQKIAQSMFDAQDGDSNWTLEEISMAKQDGEGWGQVFQRMKEEGLFAEKNLGQVVSGQGKTEVKTDADIGGGTTGGDGTTDGAAANDPDPTAESETPTFDGLSTGNRKIAHSMFDAQDGDSNWTLEEISMAKQDGEGWGQVFQRMKEEGLFAEKNLGQVVSGQGKTDADIGGVTSGGGAAGSTGSASAKGPKRIVITTGAGGQVGGGLKGHGRDNAKGAKCKGVKVTTGAGAGGNAKAVHVTTGAGAVGNAKAVHVTTGAGAVGNAKAVHVTTGAGPGGAAAAGGIKGTHFKTGGGAGGASLSGGGPAKRR